MMLKIPKTEQEPKKKITLASEVYKKFPLSKWLIRWIELGAASGFRNHGRFVIACNMMRKGYTPEDIEAKIWEFNSHCTPVDSETKVKTHLEKIFEHASKFLQDHPDMDLADADKLIEPVDDTIISVDELLQKPMPEIEYWIDELIPRNTLIIIGGRPGSWKSLFVLNMAVSMVTGKSFLNIFPIISKPKVLLYDLENGQRVVHSRISYFNSALKQGDLAGFDLSENFDKINMPKELERAKNYDVIILDSYRRFLKGEESSSEITDMFYKTFLKPLREMGKTVIIVHHFRKSKPEELSDDEIQDMFRGSSDIVAGVDFALGLFKDNESYADKQIKFNISVYKAKNRLGLHTVNFHFDVVKDDNEKRTIITYNGEKRYETVEVSRMNKLCEFMRGRDDVQTKQIYDFFSNISTRQVTRMLTDAVMRGVIESEKKGYYHLPSFVQQTFKPKEVEE